MRMLLYAAVKHSTSPIYYNKWAHEYELADGQYQSQSVLVGEGERTDFSREVHWETQVLRRNQELRVHYYGLGRNWHFRPFRWPAEGRDNERPAEKCEERPPFQVFGCLTRFSFSCMSYIGKYNKSRKAVDLQLLTSVQKNQNLFLPVLTLPPVYNIATGLNIQW